MNIFSTKDVMEAAKSKQKDVLFFVTIPNRDDEYSCWRLEQCHRKNSMTSKPRRSKKFVDWEDGNTTTEFELEAISSPRTLDWVQYKENE